MQYPITRLIMTILGTESIVVAKQRLAERLTSSRLNKALRLAELALYEGVIKAQTLEQFAEALQLRTDELIDVLEQTHEQKMATRRAQYFNEFGPHLLVETDGPHSSFTIAAMTYKQFIIVSLDKTIPSLPEEQQMGEVFAVINKHMQETDGKLPVFGQITGYCYCPSPDSHYRFDRQGKKLTGNLGPIPMVQGSATVSGKSLQIA